MRRALIPGRWIVYRYDLTRTWGSLLDESMASSVCSLLRFEGTDRRQGEPFLIGPDGRADPRVNAYFASRYMRRLDPLTWKKYAHALGLWLNFLLALGRCWDEATPEDAEFFKEWRITHRDNPALVEGATFRGDVIALRSFYRWSAKRYPDIVDPVAADEDFDLLPHGVRESDIVWLDPAGYRRWRDLGMLGLDLAGLEDQGWRGRNGQRNSAFADLLYGTGLRLVEGASILLVELPDDDPGRGYTRCRLADASAKGNHGHPYWMPRWALTGVLAYAEGARATAVRRAQASGRYEALAGKRLVLGQRGDKLLIAEESGLEHEVALDALAPAARRRLFRVTPRGLEPLAVWLNEDGLPRDPHGWQHTFQEANERVAALGLENFSATAHALRHSFALRWYSIGKLVHAKRFGHLNAEEARDFRAQFGDTWHLVATLLGHANPQMTKKHYLEPFVALDVEVLLRHAEEPAITHFLASYLADHPQVMSDPLAVSR